MQHRSDPQLSTDSAPELARARVEIARLRQQVTSQEQELAEQRVARVRAEAALIDQAHALARQFDEHQRMLRAILQYVPGFIFVKDCSGRFLLANERLASLCGVSIDRVIGHTEDEFFSAEAVAGWRAEDAHVIATRQMLQYEDTQIYDGVARIFFTTKFPIESAAGQMVAIGVIVTDVSEYRRAQQDRQRLEEGLRETQRLESLGMLAGGIAHDFNNILTSLLGYADLALLDLADGSPATPSIVEIISGIQRAAELTEQMLAYSGKGRFATTSVRISDLVHEMAGFVRISIPKKVEMLYYSDPTVPPVLADATQLRQVIMNLIINAAEAIGDQHGRIAVTTGLLQPHDRRLGVGVLPAVDLGRPHIFVEVCDTGSGMTSDVLKRLFDPFFTTKYTGRGLGMSVVHGIVRGHEGGIAIESESGVGTAITIYLPVIAGDESPPPPLPALRSEPHQRVVLVVDDEPQVLTIVQRMLERLGYTVLTAGLPDQAIARFKTDHQRIDCVLLDLTMPQMDGSELYGQLRLIDPSVRVVLCSGYSEPFATERFANLGLVGFLPKPYRIDELRRVLIDAFSQSSRAPDDLVR